MKTKITKTSKAFVLLLSFSCCLLSFVSYAQAPQAFKYQTVVRDANNEIIPNQAITLKISILQTTVTGTVVYVETHSASTNALGIVNLNIGEGTPVIGIFGAISWGTDNYFLKIEIDPAGGTTYQYMGTSQLLSVPYALYAASSGSGGGLPAGTSGQTLRHDGTTWVSSGLLLNNGTGLGIGSLPSANTQLYLYRLNNSFGANYANIYAYRTGSSGAANGGTSWSVSLIDAAIKGYSFYGNNYTAGIAGYSFLDYANSAAIIGASHDATTYGALGFKDENGSVWSGYFNNKTIISFNSTLNSPQLTLYENQTTDFARLEFKNSTPDKKWHIAGGPSATDANSRLNFWYFDGTNGFDFFSLTGNGRIGLRQYNPVSDLHIKQSTGSASSQGTAGIDFVNANTDLYHWRIYNSNDFLRFNYSSDNAATYTPKAYVSPTDGSWNQLSDISLKHNIEPLNSVLEIVKKIELLKYNYKDNPEGNKKVIGVSANQVRELFPEIVSAEQGESLLGIDYSKFGVIAIKAIQEQQEMIEKLQQIVEQQQRQIDELRNQITK